MISNEASLLNGGSLLGKDVTQNGLCKDIWRVQLLTKGEDTAHLLFSLLFLTVFTPCDRHLNVCTPPALR